MATSQGVKTLAGRRFRFIESSRAERLLVPESAAIVAHASKPGKRLSISVRACGHRLTGGDLQRSSSCVIHSTVGFPGVRCG